MSDFWKVITIASILITFAGTFVIAYSDTLVQPDLKLKINFQDEADLVRAFVTLSNDGLEPARNLRITMNPEFSIINNSIPYYTEEITLKEGGPQSLIGIMPRLANDEKVTISTLLNSTEPDTNFAVYVTHDKGSTELFYAKKQSSSFDFGLLLSVFNAITAAAITTIVAFAGKTIYKNVIVKPQSADHGGMNFQDIVNSPIIVQSGESVSTPVEFQKTNLSATGKIVDSKPVADNNVQNLLSKIGNEKISSLLHDAKIIAKTFHDDEMLTWIKNELEGYVQDLTGVSMDERNKIAEDIPDYRNVDTIFYIQFNNEPPRKETLPLILGHDIHQVENWLQSIEGKNVRLTMPYTFPSSVKYMGGKSGSVEIPQYEIKRIIHGTETKLSNYLESKL